MLIKKGMVKKSPFFYCDNCTKFEYVFLLALMKEVRYTQRQEDFLISSASGLFGYNHENIPVYLTCTMGKKTV